MRPKKAQPQKAYQNPLRKTKTQKTKNKLIFDNKARVALEIAVANRTDVV
jgi:hypothetical protein